MSKRSAPDGGYGFGAKRHYRRQVWSQFRRQFGGQMASRVVAMLPSLEGTEIDIAKQNGIREQNIIAIDRNPAIVATLKRRYPRITTYGVDAERAAERIAHDFGQIDAVNLDLCGGAAKPLLDTISAWSSHRVIKDNGSVAVTMLRGRESDLFEVPSELMFSVMGDAKIDGLAALSPRDHKRVAVVGQAWRGIRTEEHRCSMRRHLESPYLPIVTRVGSYRSTAGTQTMLYACLQVHQMPCACDACVATLGGLIASVIEEQRGERVGKFTQFQYYVKTMARIYGDDAKWFTSGDRATSDREYIKAICRVEVSSLLDQAYGQMIGRHTDAINTTHMAIP